MKDSYAICLLRSPAQESPVPETLGARGVLVHVVIHVVGQSDDAHVAKFVSHGHGVVVQDARGRDPSGTGVVSENDQLVLGAAIFDKVDGLLDV